MGEGADQRPYRDGGVESIPVAQCGAAEQVQRVPEGGPLRPRPNQQLPVDRHGTVHGPPVQPLRVRITDAAQPPSDSGLGPPEPSCDGTVPGPAGVLDQGNPAVSAAGPPRGRPRCRGRCGSGRCRTGAAHPDTAGRADRPPVASARPLRCATPPSRHRSPFMPPSIVYHGRRLQWPFRVAGRQLSPRAVTMLTIRPAVGTRPVFSDPATARRGRLP